MRTAPEGGTKLFAAEHKKEGSQRNSPVAHTLSRKIGGHYALCVLEHFKLYSPHFLRKCISSEPIFSTEAGLPAGQGMAPPGPPSRNISSGIGARPGKAGGITAAGTAPDFHGIPIFSLF